MSHKPLHLTDEERRALEARVRSLDSDPAEVRRAQAVLMAERGVPQADIAAALAWGVRSVQRHLHAFRHARLEGVRRKKAPGKPRSIPAHLGPVLLGWVEAGPQATGAPWALWTHARLAEHLRRTHGVRVARATMGDWCRAHGVAPHRPSHRYLRADAGALERARYELAKKKRPPSAANSHC